MTSPPGDKPKKQRAAAAAAQPVFAVSWPLLYSSQFYLHGWLVVKKTFSSAGKDEKKIYIYKREWKWLGFFVRERWKINWGGGKDRGGSRDSPRGGRESLSKNLYLPIVPWYSFARYLSHGEWMREERYSVGCLDFVLWEHSFSISLSYFFASVLYVSGKKKVNLETRVGFFAIFPEKSCGFDPRRSFVLFLLLFFSPYKLGLAVGDGWKTW
jgi:hypothetical protein